MDYSSPELPSVDFPEAESPLDLISTLQKSLLGMQTQVCQQWQILVVRHQEMAITESCVGRHRCRLSAEARNLCCCWSPPQASNEFLLLQSKKLISSWVISLFNSHPADKKRAENRIPGLCLLLSILLWLKQVKLFGLLSKSCYSSWKTNTPIKSQCFTYIGVNTDKMSLNGSGRCQIGLLLTSYKGLEGI